MKQKESLVLLSGLLCDESIWFEVASNLKDNAITYMISFKGCDSIESMAKKVLENTPETFCLVGHSMGGRVALEIMKQAPKRVKKLALFNTGVHGVSQKEIEGREKFINIAKNEGINSLMKQWLPPMMSESGLNNKQLMLKLEKMVLSYNVEEYLKQIGALINRPDAVTILSSIKIPTLLLSGTEDKWSPIAQHEEMQKNISNSQLIIIEKAGHMAPAEFPKEVSIAIKNWLF
jgi:pimeloyl-ACP methyl ester carboxylesterase